LKNKGVKKGDVVKRAFASGRVPEGERPIAHILFAIDRTKSATNLLLFYFYRP